MAGPVRSCVCCRRKGGKGELIKLANTPEGVVIDYSERLPGRGVYLCFERACIDKGLKGDQLKRAFRQEARPPGIDAFYKELEGKVVRKIESLLGMARKSRMAVMGFDAALEAARKTPDGLFIMAGDVSENTGRKFMESNTGGKYKVAIFSTKERLGEILGVRPVGVVFISGPALAAALDREMGRLNIIVRG
jgi:predicted RNA-binding protein YlxR (DUF448 family)